MATTDLVTIDGENYLALQDGGDMAEAMAANMAEGETIEEGDLTRAKAPLGGGSNNWLIPSIAGDESTPEIVGILAYVGRRGLLWGSSDPVEGVRPVLRTNDLITATRSNDDNGEIAQATLDTFRLPGDPERYDWQRMADPNGTFGYEANNGRMRTTEQRVLFILREDEPLPLIVTAGVGSLKAIKRFIRDLTTARIPHYRAVIKLTLKPSKSTTGISYSEIVAELVGQLSVDAGKLVKSRWTDTLGGVARAMDADGGGE